MSATEVLTAALVLITAYYAWQNRKMAAEMAAARRVTVLPKLTLEWTMVSPVLGFPTMKNVGPGPALDVRVEIRFEALSDDAEAEVREWTASVIVPGEEKQFLPPSGEGGGLMDTDALARTYSRVLLRGGYRDALGESHSASGALSDIAEWRQMSKEALGRWEEPDPTKRLAKELSERLGKKTLVPVLEAIGSRLRQPENQTGVRVREENAPTSSRHGGFGVARKTPTPPTCAELMLRTRSAGTDSSA